MLALRDHGVEHYAQLLDMDLTDVGVLTTDDRDCLSALGQFLVDSGGWERFAIWLLHKHFEPTPGEVFVETNSTRPPQTRTTLKPRAEFGKDELVSTALRFDDTARPSLISMEFAGPDDLGSSAPVGPDDEAVLAGLAKILRARGKADRFGVRLLRDHLGLRENELLLETCDIAARTLYCTIICRGELTNGDDNIETTWRWKPIIIKTGPTVTMQCEQQCLAECQPQQNGGHSDSQHIVSGHEPM